MSQEQLAALGKSILDYRLAIAAQVGDKVAEAMESFSDNGYTGAHIAKIAQRAALEVIEFRAYECGLVADPRD